MKAVVRKKLYWYLVIEKAGKTPDPLSLSLNLSQNLITTYRTEMEEERHTCLKLVPQDSDPIFVKGTWFPSHFHLSITDGLHTWICHASQDDVHDRAALWDQPVSDYVLLAERYLGFQQPGSVYRFTDAGDSNKRVSHCSHNTSNFWNQCPQYML